jgi:tRNA-uridine 2-sulfurtransferase
MFGNVNCGRDSKDVRMATCILNQPVVLTPDASIDIGPLLQEKRIGPRDGAGKTAVVAMSGGVDSAATALVMRERGYRVVGMNLRLFSPQDEDHRANPCCGIPAMEDARATCAVLGVPFYAINMEIEFGQAVIDTFVNEYAAGRTPNPCLECNRHVKFRHLVHRAQQLGADTLVTGHYARIAHGDPLSGAPHRLLRAVDGTKDQSYVLYTLTQKQLAYIQFPLGGLTKPEVRQLARAYGLPVADKEESQEICFVGNRSYAEFVGERRPEVRRPGDIINAGGEVLGEHRGLVNHTVGQRRGLGIAAAKPYFVLQLRPKENTLVVGSREEAEAHSVGVHTVSMVAGTWPERHFEASAVVRYRGTPYRATVAPKPGGGELVVTFTGERGPVASPGQAIVLYEGDEVLGGGTISEVTRRHGGGPDDSGEGDTISPGEQLVAQNLRERQ